MALTQNSLWNSGSGMENVMGTPDREGNVIATVHGAANNVRTRTLLDTGASLSMISLDLAGKFKLKIN
ncbi:LOW QUALITY PROTEIN: hypothetical protein PHMEG_00015747 [Phytophthora megakarya]|uniref:Peptidase A2 domain-containing protein n=1 Tax=Phytophthora megakarya TaxID=4795 RepID=A0A225W0M6_9STRA|nr:LOW QUALITY PROTEIN: hypothetical protein PHMEG_00015747 [Phytophthora megakarya]